MMAKPFRVFAVAAALLAAGLTTVAAAAAEKIGVAAAVRNEVTSGGRSLPVGGALFALDVVRTGADSLAQLLFRDETSMSVGPKSEVVLDRFVFDPAGGQGSVVLTATRGAFRFITGSQDANKYTVRTPVATLGFRGTIASCFLVLGGILCVVEEGSITLGGHVVEAGQALFIAADGTVTGPMTPDGHFWSVIGGVVPLPLYGGFLPSEIGDYLGPDGIPDRTEQTDPHTVPDGEDEGGCEPDCYLEG